MTSRFALYHCKAPVICLLDALHEQGLEPAKSKVVHRSAEERIYDERGIGKARSYLQFCLALPELLKAHVTSFESAQPNAY